MKVIILSLLFASSVFATPIAQNVLLSKVEEGSLEVRAELSDFRLESLDKEQLKLLANKQRIAFPKMSVELLYVRYTMDQSYRYSFFYRFWEDSCYMQVQKRSDYRKIRLCRDHILSCTKKTGVNEDDTDVELACYNSSEFCKGQKPPLSVTKIEKKYCEKLYGRKL